MTSMDDCRWYLAQYKPNCQWIAERNLKRQGLRTFLPRQETTKRVRGRFIEQVQPLFPGYIFVAFRPEEKAWRAVNSTYGVTQLVSVGLEPSQVPGQLIQQLMLRCDDREHMSVAPDFAQGDAVVLTSGPFAEFAATVDAIDPDRRVWVLLDIMGRRTRITVDKSQLGAA